MGIEQAPESGRLRTQQSIISAEIFWGIGLGAWQRSILPVVEPVGSKDEINGRHVRFVDHGDGNYTVDFDAAVPPIE